MSRRVAPSRSNRESFVMLFVPAGRSEHSACHVVELECTKATIAIALCTAFTPRLSATLTDPNTSRQALVYPLNLALSSNANTSILFYCGETTIRQVAI